MAVTWISFPTAWTLVDVQAVNNIVIQVLCGVGSFTIIRLIWCLGTATVARQGNVSVSALLTVTTIGEAWDVLLFLRRQVFSMAYWKVLAQCLVITSLTVTALLSGLVTKYSIRRIEVTQLDDVDGYLATTLDADLFDTVQWNITADSLIQANFPTDQLLDFLPNTSVPWVYTADQWNSTWSLDCEMTNATTVPLSIGSNCSTFDDQIVGIDAVIDRRDFQYTDSGWSAHHLNASTYKDVLLVTMSINFENQTSPQDSSSMNFSLASIHLHHVPIGQNSSVPCMLAPGPVGNAVYTKITCLLSKPDNISEEDNVAYPTTTNLYSTTNAYINYYAARFARESTTDSPITLIPPAELVRFYQAYTITKDTIFRSPVTRKLSVLVKVVQISSFYLAFAVLVALLCIFCTAKCAFFSYRQKKVVRAMPESKLDWILQCIDVGESPGLRRGSLNYSVVIEGNHELHNIPRATRERLKFECAMYCLRKVQHERGHSCSPDEALSKTSVIITSKCKSREPAGKPVVISSDSALQAPASTQASIVTAAKVQPPTVSTMSTLQ